MLAVNTQNVFSSLCPRPTSNSMRRLKGVKKSATFQDGCHLLDLTFEPDAADVRTDRDADVTGNSKITFLNTHLSRTSPYSEAPPTST